MSADTAFEVGQAVNQLKRIADVITAAQSDMFIRLPGLIAYFPMGIVTPLGGDSVNHGEASYNLAATGSCPIGYDGNTYRHTGGGANYLSAPGFEVDGTEVWIEASLRGLTIGGWFWGDELPGAQAEGFASKDGPAPQLGYSLIWAASDSVRFQVSGTGGAATQVTGSAMAAGSWNFVVGRYIPSTTVDVILNGTVTSLTVSVPSSLHVSTAPFEVGRRQQNNATVFHGRHRDVFICQAALSLELIEEVRQSSSP